MAFTVTWDGNDITHKVINYTRDHSLCSSTGTLTVQVTGFDSYTTWDELIIIENSVKKATYNISTITKNYNGTTTLTGENGAKRTGDYFVHTYYNPGWVSNAKYWIEKFLTEAGVDYTFNVAGNGAVIDENSAFGRDTVYNLIIPFLQHSGWYITYDENNDAEIGTLDKDLSNYVATFTRDEILSVALRKNDKMSRNKAIVWGGRDWLRDQLISAVVYEEQDWQTSSSDMRPIILSNSAIKNYSTAYGIAWKLVNEFSTLTKVKELTVAGFHNVKEGDVVFVKSDIYTGTGMITSLTSTVSNSGEITTLILDERCPRLFAYWSWDGYVYVGTWGAGVYKKPLEANSWSSYNTGLGNLFIKDLYIQNGVFVCVANDGYAYYNYITDNYWRKINHGTFTDINENEYEEEETEAVACTIDDENNIIVGYNLVTGGGSWVLHYKPLVGITRTEQVIADETEERIEIYDLDNTGERTIIGVAGGIFAPLDYTIGEGPSSYIPTHGNADGTEADGLGIYYTVRSHFHNADYFLDYPENVEQKFLPRISDPAGSVGTVLCYDNWNIWHVMSKQTSTGPWWASFVKLDANNVLAAESVRLDAWDTTSQPSASMYKQYAVFDADTVIAAAGNSVYKCTFNTGYELLGTLPHDSNYYGPYILGMWARNGNITILYYVSNVIYDGIPAKSACKYYTASYNGSFTTHGEFGVFPYNGGEMYGWDPYLEEIKQLGLHAAPCIGQLSLNTVTVGIFSQIRDREYTHDDAYMINGSVASCTINLLTGTASVAATTTAGNDWGFYNGGYENGVFPASHKMMAESQSSEEEYDNYTYTFTSGGVSKTEGRWTPPATQPSNSEVIRWGGGVGWVTKDTGLITTFDGSFPMSNTAHYPISLVSSTASDVDGALVYFCGTLTSGIIIDNGTDHVHIRATDWLSTQEMRGDCQLVGNRIATGIQFFHVSGYTEPDDGPTTSGIFVSSGRVLRDNYLLGDIIPSGSVGFTTVLSGIVGGPHIELSKTAPTIVHTESSGIASSYMWSSYTNTSGSFTPIDAGNRRIVNDVRVYTDFNENIPQSGGFRVGIASPSGFLKNMPDLSEEFTPAFSGIAVSGEVLKLETTNYDTPPFFFLVTGSGAGQKFYQRNPSSSSFFEHSTGLPASGIRIIRTDDGM